MHIPKTGGSTFYEIIEAQYGKQNIIDLNNEDVDIDFKNDLFTHKISSELNIKKTASSVCGHFRLGIHDKFNTPEPKYIAFFRNPVDQFLSQYYYTLNLNEYPDVKQKVSLTGNLEKYIKSDLCMYAENMHTYFLCRAENRNDYMKHQDEMFQQATHNLQTSFLFCGMFEYFDESLIILKEILDWDKVPYYIKKKVNKNRLSISSHDENIIETIKNINKYDNEIYKMALDSFNEAKSKVNYLTLKVLVYKAGNLFFQLKYKLRKSLSH